MLQSINGGCVYIYKNDNGTFTLTQTIRGPGDLINERFGTKVEFDGNRLVVNPKWWRYLRCYNP